jgi:hypothetical protein
MPRIDLQTPCGLCYSISTRQAETVLRAWLDEVLPHAFIEGGPGADFDVLWPRISVHPMWAWGRPAPASPDWLTDSRVLGRMIELPAKDGAAGLIELARIRRELEAELATMKHEPPGRA